MTTPAHNEFQRLYAELVPVLSRGVIGDYSQNVQLSLEESAEFNKLLMGVQVLLEVIREKEAALEAAQARYQDSQRRTLNMLDEVLKHSLSEPEPAPRKSSRSRSAK